MLLAFSAPLLIAACGLLPDRSSEAPPVVSSVPSSAITPAPTADARSRRCAQILDQFAGSVQDAAVGDAQYSSSKDYPQYRYDRFLASYAADFADPRQIALPRARPWLERMLHLADTAIRIEWRNLPAGDRSELLQSWGLEDRNRPGGLSLLRSCIQRLHRDTSKDPKRIARLADRMHVADEYQSLSRLAGLYWLTRYFTVSGLKGWHEEMRERYQQATPLGVELLPTGTALLGRERIAGILQAARQQNPLAIPTLSADDLRLLMGHFAPQLRVDVQNGADAVSTLRWGRDGSLETLITRPTSYVMPSWTRWQGQALLQLNYLFWFPRRTETELLDPYAGRLDGILWRVTLDQRGRVLFYDSIHPCGCYHTLYPVSSTLQMRDESREGEPILVYPDAPDASSQRIELQISSLDHQITAVRPAMQLQSKPGRVLPKALRDIGVSEDERFAYDLRDYNELRTLPLTGGGHRSLFNERGIVPGTQRRERLYLWPMGVPQAGSMRQWGHHATAFTGRRHFDEADLMARFFTARP